MRPLSFVEVSMSRRPLWLACSLAVSSVASFGCSAIVQPDPGRLGGTDVGGVDAPTVDAPLPDGSVPDTSVPDGGMNDGGTDAPLECTSDGMCDDGVACTRDQCRGNACTYTADDDACGDMERCAPEVGCVPILCASSAECQNGDACDGMEACAPGSAGADPATGCVAGVALDCNDGISCTVDDCDAAAGCTHAPNHGSCSDGIDCTFDVCAATSGPSGCENRPDNGLCNDPCRMNQMCSIAARGCTDGARRNCDDGSDCTADSCDATSGCVNDPVDADMDGFTAETSPSGMSCAGGLDCDDGVAAVNPGAREMCNGRDDNCDGTTDEGCPTVPDDCASAQPLVATGTTGTFRATGTFGSLAADYASICRASGADAVYYLDLTTTSDVVIDTVGSVVADTVLGVSDTCDPMRFAAACNDDQDAGAILTSRVFAHNVVVPIGGTARIYILVKAFDASTGAYTVNARVSSPRPDVCGSALDITGGGLVVGNIAGITSGARGTCDGSASSGAEALFFFRGPEDGSVTEFEANSTTFVPVVFTRTTCSSSSSETACDVGPMATITGVPASAGSSNYVFVDGGRGSPAPYTLAFDP